MPKPHGDHFYTALTLLINCNSVVQSFLVFIYVQVHNYAPPPAAADFFPPVPPAAGSLDLLECRRQGSTDTGRNQILSRAGVVGRGATRECDTHAPAITATLHLILIFRGLNLLRVKLIFLAAYKKCVRSYVCSDKYVLFEPWRPIYPVLIPGFYSPKRTGGTRP